MDASNPPAQPQAQALLEQVAKLLGVDADDPDALKSAFSSLLEAAGGSPSDDTPGDNDGSEGDGAEGVAPPKKSATTSPKIDANAVRRGRQRLGWK